MDSYVDMLSQRFNAGEMIKANGEAEALEIDRLKTQIEEYDKILQEMHRLNLKNVEMSEQVTQLIQCGIEQIESCRDKNEDVKATVDREIKAVKETVENSISELYQKNAELSDQMGKLIKGATEQIEAFQNKSEDTQTVVGRETQIVKEVVESGIEKQKTDFLKISSNQQDMLIESIDRQQRMIDSFTTESSKTLQEGVKRIEDRLMTLRAAVEESLGDMETSLKSGAKDYEPYLLAIHGAIVTNEKFDENLNQLKEMLVKLRLLMDEQQKQMIDHVHKENVKVYRNVQAVVNDQISFQTKQISDRMDLLEKKVNGPRAMIVMTFLMAAASLAIQILRLMGML
ncbi:MAG: hypothetical protein E7294_06650 [Lachnospiraceae bacterium]|jgi:hypothetical protein|nr:hypothetical protein [Lachnospiraceae bacterium]